MKKSSQRRTTRLTSIGRSVFPLFLFAAMLIMIDIGEAQAAADYGEIEARPASVFRRVCMGGSNADSLCNEDSNCPGSICSDRNVVNISVAVQFNANTTELDEIREMIQTSSEILLDITDGQMEIGQAIIFNNAFGTGTDADLRVYSATNDTWWSANTGLWQTGGSIHVSMNRIQAANKPGESLCHEIVHLLIDARDEYETQTGASASCPHSSTIALGHAACLMDAGGTGSVHDDFSELCWGHGNPSDLSDVSAGNHDANLVTEQSQTRSNRSCWDQVVWSWPNTILKPVAEPDEGADGAIAGTVKFIVVEEEVRGVLVLDESGSMNSETPSRMERLKVAATDFVAMAETDTELGIVSYSTNAESTSGHANVPIASLGAVRTTWNNAVTGLTPGGSTNITDGLDKARDMIMSAGGVTSNTFILLMTDGINNTPYPPAVANALLQDKLDELLTDGIPVYVTCTGGDLGLDSQCAEIAAGTGGFYVDSSDAARLPDAFHDIHEKVSRRDLVNTWNSWTRSRIEKKFAKGDSMVFIEKDSESATFTLSWQDRDFKKPYMYMVSPSGKTYKARPMPQGLYVRVYKPEPGMWKMVKKWNRYEPEMYSTKAYSRNRVHSLGAGVRYASIHPGEKMFVYAYPRSYGGSVTDKEGILQAEVTMPDGSTDVVMLNDLGLYGDDEKGDGVYTVAYKNTRQKGAYQFLIHADIDGWVAPKDRRTKTAPVKSPRFSRQVRISAAVGDPKDIGSKTEDKPGKQ